MCGGLTTLPSMLRTTVWHHVTIQITSDSAQVTAGPHRPWCNTEYIFVANVPRKTYCNII